MRLSFIGISYLSTPDPELANKSSGCILFSLSDNPD